MKIRVSSITALGYLTRTRITKIEKFNLYKSRFIMSEEVLVIADHSEKKKRVFKKYSYRGVELEDLLSLPVEKFVQLMNARAQRHCKRNLSKRRPMGLVKKLRKAKIAAQPGEKPDVVRTHLRSMVVIPEMVGNLVAVHNGKNFNTVELQPNMIGHHLGEFSITYKPVKHGRPGIGATHSSRFIPLK